MIRTSTLCPMILPTAQQELWPAPHQAPHLGFVLYGGTAIAVWLDQRPSMALDCF